MDTWMMTSRGHERSVSWRHIENGVLGSYKGPPIGGSVGGGVAVGRRTSDLSVMSSIPGPVVIRHLDQLSLPSLRGKWIEYQPSPAGVKAGCVRLCRTASKIVWHHRYFGDIPYSSEMACSWRTYPPNILNPRKTDLISYTHPLADSWPTNWRCHCTPDNDNGTVLWRHHHQL